MDHRQLSMRSVHVGLTAAVIFISLGYAQSEYITRGEVFDGGGRGGEAREVLSRITRKLAVLVWGPD